MSELIAQVATTKPQAPTRRGLRVTTPRASGLRRRVRSDQDPITVADPVPQGGTLNVLVLLDRRGRAQEVVEAVVDRVGPELGEVVLCVPLALGARWGRAATAVEQLRAFAEGTQLGARVAFGRRDETVALEACEGGFSLVVDLCEDAELRRTLKMCAIAYVVGPQGIARFAEESRRRPRLLTRPRDAELADWIR